MKGNKLFENFIAVVLLNALFSSILFISLFRKKIEYFFSFIIFNRHCKTTEDNHGTYIVINQNKVRTCEGNQVFSENKFQICDHCRSKQMP